jgi:hypothetical protein
MTAFTISDVEAREHLWDSFASLLRSYAAAGAVPVSKASVEHDREKIAIRIGDSTMQFLLDKQDGAGEFFIHPEGEPGFSKPFSLELDGTIHIDGAAEALDLTAIHCLSRFSEVLKRAEERTAALLLLTATI